MNLIEVCGRFPNQHECIDYLEGVRWRDGPHCPYCGSIKVARKCENKRVGRWNCYDCHSSFNVLQGTVMQGTRIPLQKWFVGIALMINAKKSLSSCQMSRDLGMKQKACWVMMQRIRKAMSTEEVELLKGIIEADETFVGATPKNGKVYDEYPGRGRGSQKTIVIGAVSRNGKVIAQIIENVQGKTIFKFLNESVDIENSKLFTDALSSYNIMDDYMLHKVINRSRSGRWAGKVIHTNTIEGFWSQLKRAWYGQHQHYSIDYMPLYIAEACWKFNHRREDSSDVFDGLIETAMRPN